LEVFLAQTPDLTNYLNNPLIGSDQKQELLDKTLKNQLNNETFKFLSVLVQRDRINLLELIISIIYCLFILRRNKCLNLYQNGLDLKVTVTNLV